MNTNTCKIIIIIFLIVIPMGVTITKFIFNKINNEKTINIVYSTDNEYKDYLKVSLLSAYMNKKPKSKYNISIICVNLNQKDIDEYKKFEKENFSIKTIPVDLNDIKDINDTSILIHHVSRADLFKFLMPDIFKDFNKILYIDSDTLIRGDLSKLYNTNIKNKYLAALLRNNNYEIEHCVFKHFCYVTFSIEYNCGVLLLNLDKMRKDNIKRKLIIAKNYEDKDAQYLMTQSAFNTVIPASEVKNITPIYNFITYHNPKEFERLYNVNFYDNIKNKAVIVHFAGPNKPWNTRQILFQEEWTKYANILNQQYNIKPLFIENNK